jgi:hypothetical protein
MRELVVLDGEKQRPHFTGEDILRAARDFIDETFGAEGLNYTARAEAIHDAARVILEAEQGY